MLHDLFNLLIVWVQMAGLTILALGCFIVAAAIYSGRIGGFVKGGALILLGGYLAGFGGALH